MGLSTQGGRGEEYDLSLSALAISGCLLIEPRIMDDTG